VVDYAEKPEKARLLRWGTKLFEQVANEIFHAIKGWRPGIRE
jgi:hypothetical protein